MKSRNAIFKTIQKQNPYWSSYLCFMKMVMDGIFIKKNVNYYFKKLVDKDDYFKNEKNQIIKDILTRMPDKKGV